MRNVTEDHVHVRAAILAAALVDTVAELRLIEVGDMVAYMRTGRWANIADLVQSSTELFFREGALSFACSGEFRVGWAEPASISLDMEFQGDAVTAFFTLTLTPVASLVEIRKVWFDTIPDDAGEGTRLFARAVRSAREDTASDRACRDRQ